MAELKTKRNEESVIDFLNKVENQKKREDSFKILELMKNLTGEEPKMWGGSMVGFGTYHYKYASGQEGDWMVTGFSPRKEALTIYLMTGFPIPEELLQNLGKFKTGKSCLYIKKLEDVNIEVLSEMILKSVDFMKKNNP